MNSFVYARRGGGLAALLGAMVAPLTSAQQRAPDYATYPAQQRVQAEVRASCSNQNSSTPLVLECACMARKVERRLAEGKMARRAIAQQQFDFASCIDRPRTAAKIVASQFTSDTIGMMRNAGVDVEWLKACTYRAIAQDMPRESLTDFARLRTELLQRCISKLR